MQTRQDIEPGLLPIFRLYTGVMFALTALGVGEALRREPRDYFAVFICAICGCLFIYLSWKPIERWLGKRWLPIALYVATLGPIFADVVSNAAVIRSGSADPTLLDPNRLYLWMLIPMLLVSAQYGWRILLVFNCGTALLPLLLALPLAYWLDYDALIGTSLVRLLLYLIAGYVVMRITSASRQQRRELAEKNAQLARYASTLEQLAIARERNRLARELHDTLAHTLSAVNVQLKALDVLMESDPAAARATLEQTQALTRTGLQEARRSLQALRARPIDELGIGLALGELARKAAERAGLQLTLEVPAQIDGLEGETSQQVYRIAEEALNNIVRHANARHIAMRWAQHTLTIRDDGAGFDTSASPNGHYGLVGMKERAELINADLKIDSAPGKGTRIQLKVKA
jgi:signal transduction histidine kinase